MLYRSTAELHHAARSKLSRERVLRKITAGLRGQGQQPSSRCHTCAAPSDEWLCITCVVAGPTRGISDTVQSYERPPQPIYNSTITYDERGDNPVSIVIE